MRSELQQPVQPVMAALSSPRAKLLYLYLAERGPATLDDIQDDLDEPLIDFFRLLGRLRQKGLIEQHDDRYMAVVDLGRW